MTTVTGRVKEYKQPRGGFLPIKDFAVTEFNDEIDLVNLSQENISPTLVGTAVDYLTRLYVGKIEGQEAFGISLLGAMNLGIIQEAEALVKTIENGEPLEDSVIISACKLSSYDAAYRVGPQFYNPDAVVIPNEYTISAIRTMVNRTLTFFESQGSLVLNGLNFDAEAFTHKIINGDGDFMTEKGLWDMKVSKNKPDSKHTLQVLIYYILGLHSPSIKEHYERLDTLGFYNPRTNTSYVLDINRISKEVISEVSKDVIGY